MKKKVLLVISLILISISLFACGGENYNFKALPAGPAIDDEIKGGNSGVVVRKGDYIFMINGTDIDYADNKFGVPVKGAIYRSKLNQDGSINENETVVMAPKLFYGKNAGDGLYIPDNSDKLYYISPSVQKDKYGNFMYYYSDIFSVNLDGTKTKKMGTVDSYTLSKFITINSKVYFVYESEVYKDENDRYVEGAEKVRKIIALGEDGKKVDVVKDYTKALIADDGNVYYTKAVSKPEGEISGNEKYNKVFKKAIINGVDDDQVKLSNGDNIAENKYNVDLVEYKLNDGKKDGALYYTKNISGGSTPYNLYFAYKNGVELQLNDSEKFTNPYFLGFDGSGNYKGTLFNTESSIILVEADANKTFTRIASPLAEDLKYLFLENDILYFMNSGKMYSVDVGSKKLNEKVNLTNFKITIDLERHYPKKIGNYIYFIGKAEEEYYSNYLYCHDITKKDLSSDYKPLRVGFLSKADDDLRIEAEEK